MDQNQKKILINALCTGIVASIATNLIYGGSGTVSYYGVSLPANIATGAGCAVGSLVSDYTSSMVITKLGISNQLMNGSTLAVKAGVGAVSSAGVLYFGGLPMENIPVALAFGAGAKLAGDYANEKIFDSRTGFLPLF